MRAVVLYATREGQTRRIAERVALDLRAHQLDVDVFDVKSLRGPFDWSGYSVACLAASVHGGHHEREMIAFVKDHRQTLNRLGAAFLSVTLSEAGAEDPKASTDRRMQSAADVRRMIEVFVEETRWRPRDVLPVAGTLAYTRYNVFIRFVMKRIARKAGAPTDTSREYELTDWNRLDRFVEKLAAAPACATA